MAPRGFALAIGAALLSGQVGQDLRSEARSEAVSEPASLLADGPMARAGGTGANGGEGFPRRRRADMQRSLEVFATAPWPKTGSAGQEARKKQMSWLGKLKEQQKLQQREMENAEEATYQDLNDKVVNQQPIMHEVTSRLVGVAGMLKKGTNKMKSEMRKAVADFDMQMIDMSALLEKLEEKDRNAVQLAEEEVNIETAAMNMEIKVCIEEVERKMAPMKKEIERDMAIGEEKAARLGQRVEDSRVKFERDLKQVKQDHGQNMRTAKDVTREYDSVYSEVAHIMDKAPMFLKQKTAQVKEAVAQTTAARDEVIEDFGEGSIEDDKTFSREMSKLPDLAADLLKTSLSSAAGIKEAYLGSLAKNRKQYEKIMHELTTDLQAQGTGTGAMLQRTLQSTRQQETLMIEQFKKQQEKENAYPQTLDQTFEDIDGEAKNTVIDIANGRQAMVNSAHESFKDDMMRMEQSSKNRIAEQVHMMTEKSEEQMKLAEKAAENHLQPQEAGLDTQSNKVALMEAQLGETADKMAKVWQELLANKKEIKAAKQRITKAMTGEDQAHVKDAQIVLKNAESELDTYMAQVGAARNAAIQDIKEEQVKLATKFEDESTDLDRDFTAKLQRLRQSYDTMVTATSNIQGILRDKLNSVDSAVAKVVGARNSANIREGGQMAAMDEKIKEYFDGASSKSEMVPGIVSSTVTQANDMVDEHEENLRADMIKSLKKIGAATQPLLDKNKALATAAESGYVDSEAAENSIKSFNQEVTEISDRTVDGALAVKDEVDKARATVDTGLSRASIEALESEVQSALAKATGHINQQNSQAVAADQAAGASVIAMRSSGSDDLAEAVSAVESLAAQTAKTARVNAESEVDAASRQVETGGSMDIKLAGEVDGVVDNVKRRAGSLDKNTQAMRSMVAEVDAMTTKTRTTLGADGQALTEAANAERAALGKQNAALTANMKRDSSSLIGDAQSQIQGAGDAASHGLAESSKMAVNHLGELVPIMKTGQGAVADTLQTLEENAEDEVSKENSLLASFQAKVKNEALSEQQKNQRLKLAFESIASDAAEHSAKFDDTMKRTGRILGKLVGADKHQMAELVKQLEDLQAQSKMTADEQGAADHTAIETVMAAAADATKEVEQRVAATKDKVKDFAEKLGALDEKANGVIAGADQMASTFDEKLAGATRRYTGLVGTEQRARVNQTNVLLKESQKNVDIMKAITGAIVEMERKTTATVKHRLGTLDLDEKVLKKKLLHTAELEKYQEEDALHKVYAKLASAREHEAKLDTWMKSAEQAGDTFKSLVVNQFDELGHDLDLSATQISEEEAAEQWAIQAQASSLKEHLGEEIHDLSSASAARLAALSQKSGSRIAAIMADSELSEAERAKQIAGIKEQARKQASRIMEDNGRMKLDQETSARNIQIATNEVESSMNRIATLEGEAPPQEGLQHVFKSIKKLLAETTSHMAEDPELPATNEPTSFAQRAKVDTDAMLQAALSESDKALKGDVGLHNRLESLAARVL